MGTLLSTSALAESRTWKYLRARSDDEQMLTLAPEVEARVQAQDAAGRLVFTQSVADAKSPIGNQL